MKDKKVIPTLTNIEFEELLKSWGSKAMESFDINEVFRYTEYQKRRIKEVDKQGKYVKPVRRKNREVKNEKNK